MIPRKIFFWVLPSVFKNALIYSRVAAQITALLLALEIPDDAWAERQEDAATTPVISLGRGNSTIKEFNEAKKILFRIHKERALTLYCRCKITGKEIDLKSCDYRPAKKGKRSHRLEWEHVVPAEAFGQSFKEWREGAPECKIHGRKYKGRRCAKKNAEYSRMEADLYNLFPEVGELNGLRSNYSMAEISALGKFAGVTFGGCKARIFQSKFEPMDFAKGTAARVYLYMDWAYPGHGIISEKNRKLFEAWDKLHPVEKWECDLYDQIKQLQPNENPILASRCGTKSP